MSKSKPLCEELAKKLGLSVAAHNPGDGSKVRVFEGLGKDYFDSHPIFMTNNRNSWSKALTFLEGYEAGASSGCRGKSA